MGTVKRSLIAARALIDTPEKWRKDEQSGHENCCAMVAVNRVFGTDGGWVDDDIATLVRLALFEELPQAFKSLGRPRHPAILVGNFNDHPATTHADIMALFTRAIEAQP